MTISNSGSTNDAVNNLFFEAFLGNEYPIAVGKMLTAISDQMEKEKVYLKSLPDEMFFASLATASMLLYLTNHRLTNKDDAHAEVKTKKLLHQAEERFKALMAFDVATMNSADDVQEAVVAHLRAIETHLLNLLANNK